MTDALAPAEPTTERWSALGGLLLSALYVWVLAWLLLAVVLPTVGFGWQPVVITSGSMQPLIRPGDIVLSSPVDAVEPGQVVTYEDPAREGALTTHRIVSVTEDGALRTQGDANAAPDSTAVPRDNVVGRGRLLVPLIGLPLLWLSGGAVLFGLWVVVTAISVAVVAGATGAGGGPSGPTGGRGVSDRIRRWAGPLETVRPRTVQRALIRRLVRVAAVVHDAVYRRHRPNPTRLRRAAPTSAVVVSTALLARSPESVALGIIGFALVVLFDPDGPQFRIGRWERAALGLGRAVSSLVPVALTGRGMMVVVMLVSVAGSLAGRSTAAFSAAASNASSSFVASSAFPTGDLTLWLQNDPEGQDTADQPSHPMTTVQPTQTTLPNYDTDVDAAPGLLLRRGGTDAFETVLDRVQRWTYTTTIELTIATAHVDFHSAAQDFATNQSATVRWYLRHCDASGLDCVELATTSVTDTDWQGPGTGFTERTSAFGPLSNVVPAGRQLELVVTEPAGGSDLWLAYDTAAQPSRLRLTTATPGVCPGKGRAVTWVQGDTRVEEADPATNFGDRKELAAVSIAAANQRSLLTVDLPAVPDGCTFAEARLLLTTSASAPGRTLAVQRTDVPFDPSLVTWLTQPSVSGAVATGPSTAKGPMSIDVTEPVRGLYDLGNTGLQLRDSVEGGGPDAINHFRSVDDRPYPDTTGPRLEVIWGP